MEKANERAIQFRDNLAQFVTKLVAEKIVSKTQLLERLEETTLEYCSLIDKKSFDRKKNRLVTKSIFEQQKFNLFREESEGYTKLLVEL